jgi:hypothetical protein
MTKKRKQPQLKTFVHPMQPIGFDDDDRIRFKKNEIVRFLLDACSCGYKFSINDLAVQMQAGGERFPDGPLVEAGIAPGGPPYVLLKEPFRVPLKPFSREDYTQLMQLIGYSTSGFGELSRVSKKIVAAADVEAERLWTAAKAEDDAALGRVKR